MNLFQAPLDALYSVPFYKQVLNFKVKHGLRYLLFLTLISTIFVLLVFVNVGLPRTDELVEWIKSEMPTLTVSGEGLSMQAESPFNMNHPELGLVATFDTSIDVLRTPNLIDQFLYVTRTKVYLRQVGGDLKTYDLSPTITQIQQQSQGGTAYINAASVDQFYKTLKPWVVALLAFFFFLFFFIWKVLAALFYSWIGLLINLGRHPKLEFSTLYTLSFFAMTAGIVLQWVRLVIPFVNNIPFVSLIGMLLTCAYLYIGIKKTEEPQAASQA